MEHPRSRRERPAKAALTRDGIVGTAVAILRAEGLEKLTMRRLAQELDTGAASLYVYVANTAELHAAVLDELLGSLDPTPTGRWDTRIETVLVGYIELLFAHPALARSVLVARPSGVHYLRLVETLLAALHDGGVPAAQAAWGVDILLQFATATAAEQSTRTRDVAAADDWDALTRAVHDASPETLPRIHATADALLGGTGRARLSWGIRALIAGIAATPVREEP